MIKSPRRSLQCPSIPAVPLVVLVDATDLDQLGLISWMKTSAATAMHSLA